MAADLRQLVADIALVPRRDDGFWDGVRARASRAVDQDPWRQLRVHDRLAVWATAEGRHAEVVDALVDRSEHGPTFAIDRGTGLIRPGYATGAPDDVLRPLPADVRSTVRWAPHVAAGRTVVRGHASLSGLGCAPDDVLEVALLVAGQAPVPLALERHDDPLAPGRSAERWVDVTSGGWSVEIPDDLLGTGAPALLAVRIVAAGHERTVEVGPVVRAADAAVVLGTTDIDGTGVRLAVAAPEGTRLRLTGRLSSHEVTVEGGTAVLDLDPVPEMGEYAVVATAPDGAALPIAVAADHPAETMGERFAVDWVHRDEWVLVLRTPLPPDQRGRFHQRLVVDEVAAEDPPLDGTLVVAASFAGRGGFDNVAPVALGLTESQPGTRVLWCVADGSVAHPTGTEPVLLHSREWHRALRSAGAIVSNAALPYYYRPRPGQQYLQTWHGTPLKRLDRDVTGDHLSLGYMERMGREVRGWTALLAQNEFSHEVLPPAFGYAGPVLTTGYPRNDRLGDPQVRDDVRARFGAGPDDRVVLYAPTWRETQKAGGGFGWVMLLDVARLREEMGDDVVVWVRGHGNTAADQRPVAAGAVDVTDHPDVTELMAGADALVTDYSSPTSSP